METQAVTKPTFPTTPIERGDIPADSFPTDSFEQKAFRHETRQYHLIHADPDYAQELRDANIRPSAIGWPLEPGYRYLRPRPEEAQCSMGCTIMDGDSFACSATGCGNKSLCSGCVYECADCHGNFCLTHIVELAGPSARFSVYVCVTCATGQTEIKVAA